MSYLKNLMKMAELENGVKLGTEQEKENPEDIQSPAASKLQFIDTSLMPLLYEKIVETQLLLKKHLKEKDPVSRAHYRYLYYISGGK